MDRLLCISCNLPCSNYRNAPQCSLCYRPCHIFCLISSVYYEHSLNFTCTPCTESFPFNHLISQNDFFHALNLTVDSTNRSRFHFNETTKVFLPFQLHEQNEFYNYMTDIDPDEQLLSTFLQRFGSSYFDEESFNLLQNQTSDEPINKLSIFSINIRSALNKISSLASYLESLQSDFSVVGLTETWLSDSTVNALNLPGYSHFSSLRTGRTGGGVSLFIKDNIQHIACPDLSMCKDGIESYWSR